MNEQISPFDLTTLSFELCLHKHNVFLASSGSEIQKAADFFQTPLFKGHGPSLHEKCLFLLGTDFLVKEITNLTSNFT
jgi:hypothetical protein